MPLIEKKQNPGYKTTEFWLTVAASIASALGYGFTEQGSEFLAAGIGAVITYILSRGHAKNGDKNHHSAD